MNKTTNKEEINLNTCVPGQKLLLRNGSIIEYAGKTSDNSTYPHSVNFPNCSEPIYPDNGRYYVTLREDERDIVQILPLSAPKPKEEDKLVILLKKRGPNKYQYKVVSQPESFRPKDESADDLVFAAANGIKIVSCGCPHIYEKATNLYIRGTDRNQDNKSQVVSLTKQQADSIRYAVKLFNEEYSFEGKDSGSFPDLESLVKGDKTETLEQITAEYQTAQIAALNNFRSKIQKLLTGKSF